MGSLRNYISQHVFSEGNDYDNINNILFSYLHQRRSVTSRSAYFNKFSTLVLTRRTITVAIDVFFWFPY
jgi:hypothetical protein